MKPHDKIKKLKIQRDIARTEANRLRLENCRLKNRLDVAAHKEIALLDQLINKRNAAQDKAIAEIAESLSEAFTVGGAWIDDELESIHDKLIGLQNQ
jgi:regulator of replication initiation timing